MTGKFMLGWTIGCAVATAVFGQLAAWFPFASIALVTLTICSGIGTVACGVAIGPLTVENGWSARPCTGCETLKRRLVAAKAENEKLLEAIR